jgi:S2P endopeptidase
MFSDGSFMHCRYMQMATFSLYLFNLLPLPMLDGAQLLTSVLDNILQSPSRGVDMDALEGGITGRRVGMYNNSWKRGIRQTGVLATTGLVGVCIILGLVTSIK